MLLSKRFKLHYWPLLTCSWFTVAFITTYLLSVLSGHLYPVFPYISDTALHPPESCVFGQMLTIGAALMAVTLYIRHCQVELAMNSHGTKLRKEWKNFALCCGTAMCLGVSFVANFQESNAFAMHMVGAFMISGIGAFYVIIQTRISFALGRADKTFPKYRVGHGILCVRVFLTVLYLFFFFVVIICSLISHEQFTGDRYNWWTIEDGGYETRLGATVSEWLLVLCLMGYVLTLTKEFKSIKFEGIQFTSKYGNIKHTPPQTT